MTVGRNGSKQRVAKEFPRAVQRSIIGDLEKLLPRPIVGSSGVNANESKQEQSGIIRSQFRGDRGATAIFRGALKLKQRSRERAMQDRPRPLAGEGLNEPASWDEG